MVKLLYWDIDGTLLNTGKAGLYAIEEAFHSLQGGDIAVPHISAGGRTDNYICQQLLLKATGVMPTDEEVTRFCRGYEKNLFKWLTLKKEEGVVFPPVKQILPFFDKQSGFRQLLLTGNSEYGAKAKLDFFHLSQYFDFDHSGFACNYYYRNDIARHVYDMAHKTWESEIEDIYVIGDTPYDIECGKVIGAKTISVATGYYRYDDLTRCHPWKQLRELPTPQEFLKMLV